MNQDIAKSEATNPVIANEVDLNELERELAMMDENNSDAFEAAVAETESEPVTEIELEAAISEVELDEAKAEVYADVEAEKLAEGADIAEAPTEGVKKEAAKKAAKPKKSTREHSMVTSKKSDVIRERLGANLAETLVLEVADAGLDAASLQIAQDEVLVKIDGLAKKVGEKAVNLIAHINDSAKLSAYTEIAFKFMQSKSEGIVSADLIAHFQDQKANGVKSYSIGTARSQGHQMFQLLPALKIAELNGKTMSVNSDSLIAAKLGEIVEA
jgi:hypothetical protein